MASTLAPTKITDKQKKWLDRESKKTGESKSSIVRGLIQAEIDMGNGLANKRRN